MVDRKKSNINSKLLFDYWKERIHIRLFFLQGVENILVVVVYYYYYYYCLHSEYYYCRDSDQLITILFFSSTMERPRSKLDAM